MTKNEFCEVNSGVPTSNEDSAVVWDFLNDISAYFGLKLNCQIVLDLEENQ